MLLSFFIDRKTRGNYSILSKLTSKEECDNFINSLNTIDKDKLLTYIECYVIPQKKRVGSSIDSHILIHYKDYLTDDNIKDQKKVDVTLQIIFCVAIILTFLLYR